MNLAHLHRKLIAAARAHPPGDSVPFAFPKRVMSHLGSRPESRPDPLAVWAGALWRGAIACLAVVLLLGAMSLVMSKAPSSSSDLTQDFEQTMLVAVDQDTDLGW